MKGYNIDDTGPRRIRRDGGVYRSDWTAYEYPSTAIVEAVAEATERRIEDVDLLDRYLDGDALDTLLRASDTATLSVAFDYDGVRVEAWDDGRIEIRATESTDA